MASKNKNIEQVKREKLKKATEVTQNLSIKGFISCSGLEKRYVKLANKVGISTPCRRTFPDLTGFLGHLKSRRPLVTHYLPIWAYLVCVQSKEAFIDQNGNEYHQLKSVLKKMQKNPQLQLCFLLEYIMDSNNQSEPFEVITILAKRFIEANKCTGLSL